MIVRPSPAESERFGMRVGRLVIDRDGGIGDLDEACSVFDVVIVRCPAERRDVPAKLAAVADFTPIAADHLCYWEWTVDRWSPPKLPPQVAISVTDDLDVLLALVRRTFGSYANHYAANPLFDRSGTLEGYCEWVETLAASVTSSTLLLTEDDAPIGFSVTDLSEGVPDVRLAGMDPVAQGAGRYGLLLAGAMADLVEGGYDRLLISTQSDNIRVQRAWARLGLLPTSTSATTHLVRSDLLD